MYAHNHEFTIVQMSRVLEVSQSGYYKWRKSTPSQREQTNKALLEDIKREYKRSLESYGSPRIHQELLKHGWVVSRQRVARMMRKHGIQSKIRAKWVVTTDSKHHYRSSPNLLDRDFKPGRKGQAWVSDITYLPTRQGWLYVTMIMDLFDRKIIGWAMSVDLKAESTVLMAWEMACKNRRPGPGLIFHSDRGSQYACDEFRDELKRWPGVRQSMSRKGNCWDNAPAESFFKSMKAEARPPANLTIEQTKTIVFNYIEIFYNTKRLHSALGYLSPTEYAALITTNTAA